MATAFPADLDYTHNIPKKTETHPPKLLFANIQPPCWWRQRLLHDGSHHLAVVAVVPFGFQSINTHIKPLFENQNTTVLLGGSDPTNNGV